MGYLSASFLPLSSCFFLDFTTGTLNQCQNLYLAALSWVCKRQIMHGSSSGSKYNLNCTENDGGYCRKEQVTQCDWICSASVGGTKRHCPYLSVLVPACILEAHLTGSPLSHAPHSPRGTWQHSWLHHHLAYSSLHIFLLVYVLPSSCLLWGTPCRFCCLTPQPTPVDPTKLLLTALSGLLLSLVQSSSLQSVELWQTVFFILLLPYQPPEPTLLTLSYMGGHPGVRLPGWKTGGF